jgi:phosphoribosylaminoimidazole-succinocarboxamide synthase
MTQTVWQTQFDDLPAPRRGKVRDIYDLGDQLLIVACDRVSAYDHVLQPGIPGKGKILTQLSNYWFELFADEVPNHLIATRAADFPTPLDTHAPTLDGRAILVKKAAVVPFECVARGYLAGSGYREYKQNRSVCDVPLPDGLVRADRLPEPIFTPATKAETGHDENVSFEVMSQALGADLANRLRSLTLAIYSRGADQAAEKGLILADTKFEFGQMDNGDIILIDEVLTPDSSRFWDAPQWEPGTEPVSLDKQYVRNWLDDSGWNRESPPPAIPEHVVEGTLQRYLEAFRKITGREPDL